MRPEKAIAIIDKSLSEWYSPSDTRTLLCTKDLISAINKWLEKFRTYKKACNANQYPEYFPYSEEVYTFDETHFLDNWRYELYHISDRWKAEHRLEWLLQGITKGFIEVRDK